MIKFCIFFFGFAWRARAFAHSILFFFKKVSLCRENLYVNIGQLYYFFIRKVKIGKCGNIYKK